MVAQQIQFVTTVYTGSMDKDAERLRLTTIRKTISSSEIPMQLISQLTFMQMNTAHIYLPNSALNEISTKNVIKWLKQHWPSIQISSPEMSKNALMHVGPFDVIFIPVLGFDTSGNRIGMGGGWYDRFLAMHTDAVKIGLAYDECEVPKIEPEPHDVRLDYILTPTRLIDANKLQ